MKKESKTLLWIVAVVVVVGIGFVLSSNGSAPLANSELLVRADSHTTATGVYNYPVTLVEFGDYQCPACGFAEPLVEKLLTDYGNQIKLVFRHFPLSQHKNALLAAQAAEAAGEQGKFWEMHRLLYTNQSAWGESDQALSFFLQYADQLKLNKETFTNDLQTQKFLSKVQNDQKDGNSLNIDATPTFFMNGKKYAGNLNYPSLKNSIDQALKETKKTTP